MDGKSGRPRVGSCLRVSAFCWLFVPDVADEVSRAHLGAVDDRPTPDRGDALRRAAAALGIGIRNEVPHGAIPGAADPDTALPSGVRQVHAIVGAVPRLGVGDEHVVVGVDEDPGRSAELVLAIQVVTVLVVDLNAVVIAIAGEQPAL